MNQELKWEDYVPVRRPTKAEVIGAEKLVGVRFPEDFVELLLQHQGQVATPDRIGGSTVRSIALGAIMYVTDDADDAANLVERTLARRQKGYPALWIPFTFGGGQTHFALDYSEAKPRIVYVYPDGDAESRGFWSKRDIASTVTELLQMLED